MIDIIEQLEAAHKVVVELCNGTRTWTMSIPANVDRDPDLIIGGALREAQKTIAALRAEVERLRDTNERFIADFALIAGKLGEFEEQNALRAAKEKAEAALCRIAGELGEFADADGDTMVEKIRFFRGELEKAEGEVRRVRELLHLKKVYELTHPSPCPHELELKRIGEETTCCVYCGERFSWKEPTENITKHIEECDKHPLKFWIGQAELYKSEFLGRDAEWKKAEAELARYKEAVKWACGHEQIPSWPYFIDELRRRVGGG